MVNGAGAGGVRPRKTSLALEAMLATQMAAKLDRSFRSASTRSRWSRIGASPSICYSVGLSCESVSSGGEVVSTFLWAEEVADFSNVAPQGVDGSERPGAQQSLELGESHLDWVEVGARGRQE